MLRRSGVDLSARQVLRAEQDRWGSGAQLAAEQDTIASVVGRERWVALLRRSGLDTEQVEAVLASDALGPLCAALRRAEDAGYDALALLPMLIRQRTLFDAEDIASVLRRRLIGATGGYSTSRTRRAHRLVPSQGISGDEIDATRRLGHRGGLRIDGDVSGPSIVRI